MAKLELILRKDGSSENVYKCNGQNYWIDESTCNGRQARDFKGCARCTLRIGGKNDPRPTTLKTV